MNTVMYWLNVIVGIACIAAVAKAVAEQDWKAIAAFAFAAAACGYAARSWHSEAR